ncbi:MAG: hypothetical protein ACYCU7_00395 [Acidimicrobiales bacterium]
MTMLRLRSAEHPFDDTRVAGQAARLLALVEATGVWAPGEIVSVLDLTLFEDALGALADAGVAPTAVLDAGAYAQKPAPDIAEWIAGLRDAVAMSPVPDLELPKLDALFGNDRLARLVGVGASTMRRYVARERPVSDEVAQRVHLVTRIVGELAGSFNERGIRKWFERPRRQLDGRSPEEVLRAAWESDGEAAAEPVLALASQFTG